MNAEGDVHQPEPSHAQQLRDKAGILAVGLDHHRKSSGIKSRTRMTVADIWRTPLPYCIATDAVPPRKARCPRSLI
jgi:hypothetical protein